MKRTILFALGLGILGARVCAACTPEQLPEPAVVEKRAKNAIDIAAYDRDLAACQDIGRDSGSFVNFELCARAADQKHGLKP